MFRNKKINGILFLIAIVIIVIVTMHFFQMDRSELSMFAKQKVIEETKGIEFDVKATMDSLNKASHRLDNTEGDLLTLTKRVDALRITLQQLETLVEEKQDMFSIEEPINN